MEETGEDVLIVFFLDGSLINQWKMLLQSGEMGLKGKDGKGEGKRGEGR